jgi:hypothetical protein
MLAFRIACDLHPGFQFVYDDLRATLLNRQGANLPTLEGLNPSHRPKGSGWAPALLPQFLAILGDAAKKNLGWTDRQFCDFLVRAYEPSLEKPNSSSERRKKAATLNRRLTMGRRLRREAAGS